MTDDKKKPAGGKSIGSSMKPAAKPSSIKSKVGSGSRPPVGQTRIQRTVVSSAVPKALSAEKAEELATLDNRLSTLQNELGLSKHYEAIGDLDNGLSELLESIADCRRRGYCYQSYLERKVETLDSKWDAARPRLLSEMSQAETELQRLLNTAVQTRNNLGTGSAAMFPTFDRNLDAAETRLSSVDTALQSIYSGVRDTYYQTQQQVEMVKSMLDHLDMATFSLIAGESPVQAVEAKWWRDGQGKGPEGILYLTDQRLLFEQKEEVATKKVLFIATEKETVRQLVFEAPLGSVKNVKSSAKGLMGHEDHLDFEFGAGAPFPLAHFHIKGQESDEWLGIVKRVQTGDIQSERTAASAAPASPAQAADAAASNAPQRCSACSAPITTPIMHGQRQIECEYCGTTMRW